MWPFGTVVWEDYPSWRPFEASRFRQVLKMYTSVQAQLLVEYQMASSLFAAYNALQSSRSRRVWCLVLGLLGMMRLIGRV